MTLHYSTGPDLDHEKEVIERLARRPKNAICRLCRYSVEGNNPDYHKSKLLCTRFGGEADKVTGDVNYPTCESRRVPLREAHHYQSGVASVRFNNRSENQYCGVLGVRWEAREKGNE